MFVLFTQFTGAARRGPVPRTAALTCARAGPAARGPTDRAKHYTDAACAGNHPLAGTSRSFDANRPAAVAARTPASRPRVSACAAPNWGRPVRT